MGLLIAAGLPASAASIELMGGGPAATDCYAALQVETEEANDLRTDGARRLDEIARDGACTFRLRLCASRPAEGCERRSIDALETRPRGLAMPAPALDGVAACGEAMDLVLPLNGRAKRKQRVLLVAHPADGSRRDVDRFTLRCLSQPTRRRSGPPQSCLAAECPANGAGGPDEVIVTLLATGSDLDNGWTGVSHNFPLAGGSQLRLCLTGCGGDDPVCEGIGLTGPGSINGETFGPPLPLLAGGVPVCLVNRFSGDITGTWHAGTGETQTTMPLATAVYITDSTRVCPQCDPATYTCDSGANFGAACAVDSIVRVVNSTAEDKDFRLSRDCPPLGVPAGVISVPLPLTTGTSTLAGPVPCQEGNGVPARDDNCGAAACGSPCEPGSNACATMGPDPTDPTRQICFDIKGGASQLCCDGHPSTPCFPTRDGGTIVRVGRAVAPVPAAASDSYPKGAPHQVLAATFCEAASESFAVDAVTGLPGPGAALLNSRVDWCKH